MKVGDLVVISNSSIYIHQNPIDENGNKIPFKLEQSEYSSWDWSGNGGFSYMNYDLELYNPESHYEIY